MTKIVVGVSGGVDSSVSLALLKEKGFSPIAVSLVIPVYDINKKRFVKPSKKEINLAKDVCKKLNIKHFVYDVSDSFVASVIEYILKDYKKGKVPNPCAFCNRFFKFKWLFDFAKKKNVSLVATGHYAKIEDGFLKKAKDISKDQTYGLCFLKKAWLKRLVFPLGEITKKEVYSLAEEYGFLAFKKEKQSQDLCFLKTCSINDFLKAFLKETPGKIIDINDNLLGTHQGSWFFTCGQRKGLGFSKKYFVVKKQKNKVVVTDKEKDLYTKRFSVTKLNFLTNDLFSKNQFLIKTRYSQKPVEGKVIKNKDIEVILKNPQRSITPGQVCVFYNKDVCVGGGFIK